MNQRSTAQFRLPTDAGNTQNRRAEMRQPILGWQHEKGPAQSTSQVKPPSVAPTSQQKASPTPWSTENSSTPRKDLGNVLGADGKLTEAEKERCRLKNLCMYCGCPFDKHDLLCRFKNQPPPATGRATFILTGDPTSSAMIEEVLEPTPSSGN